MKLLQSSTARARASAELESPTVVLVEPDPYLAFLIRLHVPEARVVEADASATAADIRELDPDLVVVGVDNSPLAIPDLLRGEDGPKILAVVDGARAARTSIPTAIDGVLARPFVPSELHHAVRHALGLDRKHTQSPAGSELLTRARSWLAPARFAAVLLGGVIDVVATDWDDLHVFGMVVAIAYACARLAVGWFGDAGEIADVIVAAGLIGTTGGLSSSYMPFAIVVAAGVGLTRGPRVGALGGFMIAAGSGYAILRDLGDAVISGREVVAWYLLMPLVGVTGGFASRVWRAPVHPGFDLLAEANRVLSSLYRIARTIPGGLEIGTVADSAMIEIRDTVRSSAGAMLLSEAGAFIVVGSFGLRDPTEVMMRDPDIGLGAAVYRGVPVLKREEMHPLTAQALGDHECWLCAPIKRDGIPLGLLIAACPSHEQHDSNRLLLMRLAEEVAVAVENARLFSRVREISIDEERRRLARELHDGVAQALTHVRFELDFMARHEPRTAEELSTEMQRLARVVARASDDVRSMILGLRSSVSQEGLVGSLRSYLSDLRGLGGPDIVFETRGEIRLKHDVEIELFRIAQEAVSNALRHAKATVVHVSLVAEEHAVKLVVEDDGIGIDPDRPPPSVGGVGLDAMEERAVAIGALLSVDGREHGGTRVSLTYLVEERT